MKEIRQSPSLGAQHFYFLMRARCRGEPACSRWILMAVPVRDEIYQSAPGIEPLMRQFIQEHKMRDGKGAGGCCGFTGQTIQTPGQSDSQDLLFSFREVPRVQNQHNWSVRRSKEGLKWWVTEMLFGRRTFLFFGTDIPMRAVQGRGPKKRGVFPVVVVLLLVDWVNETPQHSAISSAVWWRAERRATEGIAQERPSHFTFATWFSDCSSTRRRLMQRGRRQDKERKLETNKDSDWKNKDTQLGEAMLIYCGTAELYILQMVYVPLVVFRSLRF